MADSFCQVLLELIIVPGQIVYYSVVCWQTTDFYGPVGVYGFFIVAAIVTRVAVIPVVRVVYVQERLEAVLR